MPFLYKNIPRKIIRVVILSLSLIFLLFLFSPLLIFYYGKHQIYIDSTQIPSGQIAIVFGAGVKSDGTPSDMLKDRLLTATELYNSGIIDKILVSGDNRFEDYNEPEVMYQFLVTQGILADDIVRDYAGRRTYDTCIRAKTIWGLDRALLISQGYHLPRAIFTCHALGIESSGYSATLQPYINKFWFKTREVLALYVSVLDVYFLHPDYVTGESEDDFR